jgi:hypothetical protein
MTPRATLGTPGGARRLDRIIGLMGSCRSSFHDLSRVEIDLAQPPTPRMNMPFELGLTVAWDRILPDRHLWFVLESVNRRALKSLSDLAGTDVYIHNGRGLQSALPEIMEATGAQSRFEARAFRELLFVASGLVKTMRA